MTDPIADAVRPASRSPRRAMVVTITPGTAAAAVVVVMATVALWSTLQAARSILAMTVASAILALMVAGPIARLAERVPRAIAIVIVALVGFVGIGGIGYSVYRDLDAAFELLQTEAPQSAARLEKSDRFGQITTDLRLEERVQSAVDGVREGAQERARSTAFRAVNYFVAFVLAIFFLVYGNRIFQGAADQIEDDRRRDVFRLVVERSVASARSYLGLELANAVVLGVVLGAVFHRLGLPGASAVAFLAALGSVVPHVGLVVGAIPALLLIAASEPYSTFLVMAAGMIALQVVESFYAQRILVRRLHVGAAVTLLSFLIGFGIYGVGGAVFSVAIAVFGSAVIDALGDVIEEPDLASRATSPS